MFKQLLTNTISSTAKCLHAMKLPAYQAYCKLLEIFVSRKMIILIISTWLLTKTLISPEIWSLVAAAVLGAQTYLSKSQPHSSFYEEAQSKKKSPGASKRIP